MIENNKEEKKIQIPLERHMWPDEIEELEKKKREKKKNTLVVLLMGVTICVALGLGFFLGNKTQISNNTSSTSNDSELNRFEMIYKAIKENWYFYDQLEEDGDNLVNRAINGMIGSDYDKHSAYMSEEQTVSFADSIDLGFVGIGVQYQLCDKGAHVERVYLDSPAMKAGIQVDDIICEVEHKSIVGWQTDEIVDAIRGEEGTIVNLTVYRDGETFNTDATRGAVENSIYGEICEGYAYLEIVQFSSVCASECERYFKYFKENGINRLIIDVRDDGGGYLNAILELGNMLLDEGQIILTQEYRDGTIIESKANDYTKYTFDKIVILGNQNSASASEALIACLTQNNKAIFVGTNTYGKSTIQTPRYYTDGRSLKLTTGMWKTPNGSVINGVGLKPDIEVKLHEIFYFTDYMVEEDDVFEYDDVASGVKISQLALDFLGYEVDRCDGYFSSQTTKVVKQYQSDKGLDVTGQIDYNLLTLMISDVSTEYATNKYDVQLFKAKELVLE